jgi:hypothetical protein
MNTILSFTFGVIATLLTATWLMPAQTTIQVQTTVDDTVHITEIITVLELDHIRDISEANAGLDQQLSAECAYALQRLTDEPLAGLVHYLERYWAGDACAAYQHQVTHGWH